MISNRQSYRVELDVIRVWATVGVVAIHTEVITSSPTNYLGGISWWFANLVHSLVSISVPLFIMLTGALVLSRRNLNYAYILNKSFKKFFLPMVIWSLLYAFWNNTKIGSPFLSNVWLKDVFTSNIGHLYFLEIIIGLYLLIPLIAKLWNRLNNKNKWKTVTVGLIFVMILNYLKYLLPQYSAPNNILNISLPFIFYLLCGNLLSTINLSKKHIYFSTLSIFLITLITGYLTYKNILFFNLGQKIFWTSTGGNLFYEPFTLNIILMSLGFFVVAGTVSKQIDSLKLQKIINFLSGLTFGIYLIHPIVLELIDHYFNLAVHQITYPLWIYYIQKIILVSVASGLLVFIMKKIPVVKLAFGD